MNMIYNPVSSFPSAGIAGQDQIGHIVWQTPQQEPLTSLTLLAPENHVAPKGEELWNNIRAADPHFKGAQIVSNQAEVAAKLDPALTRLAAIVADGTDSKITLRPPLTRIVTLKLNGTSEQTVENFMELNGFHEAGDKKSLLSHAAIVSKDGKSVELEIVAYDTRNAELLPQFKDGNNKALHRTPNDKIEEVQFQTPSAHHDAKVTFGFFIRSMEANTGIKLEHGDFAKIMNKLDADFELIGANEKETKFRVVPGQVGEKPFEMTLTHLPLKVEFMPPTLTAAMVVAALVKDLGFDLKEKELAQYRELRADALNGINILLNPVVENAAKFVQASVGMSPGMSMAPAGMGM